MIACGARAGPPRPHAVRPLPARLRVGATGAPCTAPPGLITPAALTSASPRVRIANLANETHVYTCTEMCAGGLKMTRLKRRADVLLQYSELFGFVPIYEYEYESGSIVADIEMASRDVQEPMRLLNDATRKRLAAGGIAVDGGSIQRAVTASPDAGGL